ncbi:MAG: hypothetical protein KF791_14285 [Verrucomicrobiae bacterium]|nr:hypothetical protein [Verrucomicrobiae bacterium]
MADPAVPDAAPPEVPRWILVGVAGTESSSFYNDDGSLTYVNRARGRHGEIGPWQMTRRAFLEVRRPGEVFEKMGADIAFAEAMVIRRFQWLQERTKDWDEAVRAYNAGVSGARRGLGRDYLRDVKRWVRRIEPELLP